MPRLKHLLPVRRYLASGETRGHRAIVKGATLRRDAVDGTLLAVKRVSRRGG